MEAVSGDRSCLHTHALFPCFYVNQLLLFHKDKHQSVCVFQRGSGSKPRIQIKQLEHSPPHLTPVAEVFGQFINTPWWWPENNRSVTTWQAAGTYTDVSKLHAWVLLSTQRRGPGGHSDRVSVRNDSLRRADWEIRGLQPSVSRAHRCGRRLKPSLMGPGLWAQAGIAAMLLLGNHSDSKGILIFPVVVTVCIVLGV